MKEANYYRLDSDNRIRCELCPRFCQIPAGKAGFCNFRRHEDGRLVAANYGLVSALALDPVEKKPFYHYYPGKTVLSVGTVGCNLACEFCQNWHISRECGETTEITPEELKSLAIREHRERGSIGLAYTYSEPVVWWEFLQDVMPLIRQAGLKNLLVTNAFLQPEPWKKLLWYTDAANIDLKGFDDAYYHRCCHGKLQPVLDNILSAAENVHLELTTLLVPGENDAPDQIKALARWIATLDPGIPLHFSRYFPNYRKKDPATPLENMHRAYKIAKEYLQYVYLGNMEWENNTYCPYCGVCLVERVGYRVIGPSGENCPGCGHKIPIRVKD